MESLLQGGREINLASFAIDATDVDREIEEDIQEEQENTRSFAAETTKCDRPARSCQRVR
jgi:hypothetical protein